MSSVTVERINKRKVFYINNELKRTIVLVKDKNLGVQPLAYFHHTKDFMDKLVAMQTELCAKLATFDVAATTTTAATTTAEQLINHTDPIIWMFNKNPAKYFYEMQVLRRELKVAPESALIKNYRYQITFFYEIDDNGERNIVLVLDNCVKVKKPRDIPYERLVLSLFGEYDIFLKTDETARGFTFEEAPPSNYLAGKTLRKETLKKIPFIAAADLPVNKLFQIKNFNFLKPCEQPVIGRGIFNETSYIVLEIKWSTTKRKLVMCHPAVFCMLRSAFHVNKSVFITKSEIADTIRTVVLL